MSFSLYQATVPSYLQMLRAVTGLLDKAEAWCAEQQRSPDTLVTKSLAEDMLPFAYQINSCSWHSLHALNGVRGGLFTPNRAPYPQQFDTLKNVIAEAIAGVEAFTEDEVNSWLGQAVRFEMGNHRLDFVAEDFLMSFSLPQFYFHVTTAYDVLRWLGVPIGKADFMGKMRTL